VGGARRALALGDIPTNTQLFPLLLAELLVHVRRDRLVGEPVGRQLALLVEAEVSVNFDQHAAAHSVERRGYHRLGAERRCLQEHIVLGKLERRHPGLVLRHERVTLAASCCQRLKEYICTHGHEVSCSQARWGTGRATCAPQWV
jgi:hypothetical protein